MPKEKKMLAEAKRVQAEANRLRDLYISRNAEGRERLMEMANVVNHPHYKRQADSLEATQLAAVKSARPHVEAVEGVRSLEPPRRDCVNNDYWKAIWKHIEPRKVANAPQWDFVVEQPDKYLIFQFKQSQH